MRRPDHSMLTYLRGLAESLRELVPRAVGRGQIAAVHHARVTTRRLRAALDLLAPALPQERSERFSRALRQLRRRLGNLRDVDVMLGHLQEFVQRAKIAPAAAWMTVQLREARVELREQGGERDAARILGRLGSWWALEPEVAQMEALVPGLLATSVPAQLTHFTAQARALSATTAAGDGHDPHRKLDIHALRIAGKRLRYTLEIAAVTGHRLPQATARLFKQLQDALGQWHDHVVLAERIMQTVAKHQIVLHDRELFAACLRLVKAVWEASQRELRKFARLWTGRGEALAAEIHQKFAPPPPAPPPAAPAHTASDQPLPDRVST